MLENNHLVDVVDVVKTIHFKVSEPLYFKLLELKARLNVEKWESLLKR